MRASMRIPIRAVAYRREKLIPNRTAARPTITAMYGQRRCEWPTIAWSIARWVRRGIVIETSVYANASDSPRAPRRRSSHQSRSSLRSVGSRPRSGGSTWFTYPGMANEPAPALSSAARAAPPTLAARATLGERREAVAEARRRRRGCKGQARLGGLAPVQHALACEQRVSLGLESFSHQAELVLACLEPRLEPAQCRVSRGQRGGALRRTRVGWGTRMRPF